MNHSIWIEHGDDLEDKLLPEHECIGMTAGEVMEETSHDPAGVGLPRVNTC